MRKRLLISVLALGVLAILGFGALAWRPAIAPIVPPAPGAFAPELVAKGAALAAGGYCAECHTAKGGQQFAGGYAMATPFGLLYSTNITPDPETGIGTWSEAAFARAMRHGVARDGSLLFPAFPYDHFTKLSDGDVQALYAFFMTRAPVRAPAHANGLPFPLNVRYLQAGWRLLFFRPGRFEPDAGKGAEWNRGAYLAEGLSHCGACHTPRNLLGAEKSGAAYAGAGVDNWIAPPLTAANLDPVPWTSGARRVSAKWHERSSRVGGRPDGAGCAWPRRASRIGRPGHRSLFRRHRPCRRARISPPLRRSRAPCRTRRSAPGRRLTPMRVFTWPPAPPATTTPEHPLRCGRTSRSTAR